MTFNDKDPAWATEYLKSKINMHKNILISLENWQKKCSLNGKLFWYTVERQRNYHQTTIRLTNHKKEELLKIFNNYNFQRFHF